MEGVDQGIGVDDTLVGTVDHACPTHAVPANNRPVMMMQSDNVGLRKQSPDH